MQQQDGDVAEELSRRMVAGCVAVRVGRLQRLVAREFERRLRPRGLSLPQLEILAALTTWHEPVRPTVVADLLGVERSTMSRNLAGLQERGWVRSTDRSASGRSRAVTITEAGTTALARADEAWTECQASVVDRLGPEAAVTLDRWLTSLTTPDPSPDPEPSRRR